MAQYNTGTVDVTNGSPIITGVGTEWLANVTGGTDYIVVLGVAGEDIHRLIATVDNDTQLTLAAPFTGGTDTGRTYAIIRDFTLRGYALMDRQDQALQEVYNQAITAIDSDIATTPFTLPVSDITEIVQDPVDGTKRMRIDVGAVATATTRVLSMANEDTDLAAPGVIVRRAFQEPITGDSLSGVTPFDFATMAGEMLQCDNSSIPFVLQLPDPNTITGWDGLLCLVRTTSGNNLASITVPNVGNWSWQNGYPNANQNATQIYLGYAQGLADGLITPVYHRTVKFSVIGNVRENAGDDLSLQFGTASADARGGKIFNYLNGASTESGVTYTFTIADGGNVKIFDGTSASTWTIPTLTFPSDATVAVVVHNVGSASITFAPSGVTAIGSLTLAPNSSCSISWLPGDIVKLTGELT